MKFCCASAPSLRFRPIARWAARPRRFAIGGSRVSAIIPAEGLGRFSLFPNQQLPHDAFVAAETLQDALEQPHKVNAIFVSGRTGTTPDDRR